MKPGTERQFSYRFSVNEIFYSIQGESLYAGRPCVFVRLAGCNLRCTYCDTRYAYFEGRSMDIEEIVAAVRSYDFPLVEITGGEPLMQAETSALVQRLIDAGLEVMMETNGTLPIDRVPQQCLKIVDIKCPGSGESEKTDFENIGRLGKKDQVKFVICDRKDYEFARDIIKRYWSEGRKNPVLISPVAQMMDPATAAAWILEDRLDVRLHLQMHKILWPHIDKGV